MSHTWETLFNSEWLNYNEDNWTRAPVTDAAQTLSRFVDEIK